MKCVHVITELCRFAGTTTFALGIANGQAASGDEVTVAIRNLDYPDQQMPDVGVRVITIKDLIDGSVGYNFDVMHIHGLWNYPLHRAVKWAREHDIPYVMSPHGMMTAWAMRYKWFKKFVAWHVYQYGDCRAAAIWHVTSHKEREDVRRLKFIQPIVECPLGVPMPKESIRKNGERRTVAFLSRVHPTKGVDNLIAAWKRISHEGWRLVIAGPGDPDYLAHVAELIEDDSSVTLVGRLYGEEKARLYQNSDIFVLPTYTENFGVVVVESLSFGTPVITTVGAPWKVIEEIRAGYWIGIGVEHLMVALKRMMALTDRQRVEMGQRGREYVEKNFSWNALVPKMRDAYMDLAKR